MVETMNLQLIKLTNKKSLNKKSPRLLSHRIKERYYKTLGTSVKTAHCPLSLCKKSHLYFSSKDKYVHKSATITIAKPLKQQ